MLKVRFGNTRPKFQAATATAILFTITLCTLASPTARGGGVLPWLSATPSPNLPAKSVLPWLSATPNPNPTPAPARTPAAGHAPGPSATPASGALPWLSAAPVPTPVLTQVPPHPPANNYKPRTAPFQPIHLAPLRPVPGFIMGRAVFEDGSPIPNFHVHAAGDNGKFAPFLNNQLSGPQISLGATTFGDVDAKNGRYRLRVNEDARIFCVTAWSKFHFHGKVYTLDMWPTDNLGNTTAAGDFRGQVARGIVRDFVLKLDGLRPDHNPAQFPDNAQVGNETLAGGYYGGTIDFTGDGGATDADWYGAKTSLRALYPKGSRITMTLTPTGPRVDGLPASTLVRSTTFGPGCFSLYGIPYGSYTMTAQVFGLKGAPHDLKLALEGIQNAAGYGSWIPVEWTPLDDGNGMVITAEDMWVVP